MGQLIDCRDEFEIRQTYNRIQRALVKTGYADRIVVVVEEDAESDSGIAFSIYDKYSRQTRRLDPATYQVG